MPENGKMISGFRILWNALLIIDMQYDFIDGSLKVDEGEEIIPSIKKLLNSEQTVFDLIVFTKDDHPKDHISFASNHKDKKPFSE